MNQVRFANHFVIVETAMSDGGIARHSHIGMPKRDLSLDEIDRAHDCRPRRFINQHDTMGMTYDEISWHCFHLLSIFLAVIVYGIRCDAVRCGRITATVIVHQSSACVALQLLVSANASAVRFCICSKNIHCSCLLFSVVQLSFATFSGKAFRC